MNTVSIANDIDTITEYFNSILEILPGSIQVKKNRNDAYDKFVKLGFPVKSNEEYKYSSTEKLFKEELQWNINSGDIPAIDFQQYRDKNADAAHIFLVNGVLVIEESDLSQVTENFIISDLNTASVVHPALFEKYYGTQTGEFNDAFAQLNTAMASHGLFIYLKSNTHIKKPIQINNICNSSAYSIIQTHHLVVAESFSSINIIETFNSIDTSNTYLLNTLAEVVVGQNATMNYYQLQNESDSAYQVNTKQVTQLQDSHFDTNTVTLGGKWLRNNLNILLKGVHCESHLNGLQLLKHQQHVDNHTLVDHQMPHCESNQLYKGILNGKSTGVFNGKIFVRKDAQKTNAYQSSKNMLLSDDATMNTKPQLEIYADDVKCSHGSSTGQIDANAIFYLRARGLSTDSAKAMLMYAFAVDVIQTIKIEAYKNYLDTLIEKCFE